MNTTPLLGPGGTIFMALYLFSLIGIGLWGRFTRKEDSMADFYLAGRGMSLSVLFLTLYATQYSGNTLIGFAGKAYREGYFTLTSVMMLSAVVGGFLIYAPRFYRLSRRHHYITVGDYIHHRFNSTTLTVFASILIIVAMANYILTNLKAVGFIVETTTGGQITFAQGVIVLSLIMVIYETLGGMRSVALTDVIQGVLLMAGVVIVFITMQIEYGGLSSTARFLAEQKPEMWMSPDWPTKRLWFSTILLGFFGVAIYPHAIQRIYAAKNERTLRRSLQLMAFMPLITTFFMVMIGVVGSTQIPGLDRQGSEQIALLLVNDMAQRVPALSLLLVLFISAAVAAIMSTIDSALLAISSLATQDLYRRLRPEVSQAHLTRFGKVFSWLLMALVVYLALVLPQTIWRLMEVKLELLIQVAPSIFLGVHLRSLRSRAVLMGMITGTTVALAIMFGDTIGLHISNKPWGVHAGVWGLMINSMTIAFFSLKYGIRQKEG